LVQKLLSGEPQHLGAFHVHVDDLLEIVDEDHARRVVAQHLEDIKFLSRG
jgi:hypothetical protein